MPSVVINADDLGLHVAVRRAVERLAARGTLTSASVLANGADIEGAARVQGVSLGAHLNILRGRPISPPEEIPSLVGEGGYFLGNYPALFRRYRRRELAENEVELEWSRQVETLQDRGMRLWHLDSEKHVHALPRLFAVACAVAARCGIPFVRRPNERWRVFASPSGQLRVLLLNRWVARGPGHPPPGVRWLDEVWGIAEQANRLEPGRFARALGAPSHRSASVEIVCHPGAPLSKDVPLPADYGKMRVRRMWEPEFRTLLRDPWCETLGSLGWTLTSFRDLANPL